MLLLLKEGGIDLLLMIVVLFSVFYLFQINRMTYALCMRREIRRKPTKNIPNYKYTYYYPTCLILH